MNNFKERFNFCHFDGYNLTEQSKESMYNYFVHGLEPGGFMTAVLSNDLFGAASRADFENRKQLYGYAAWLAAYAPYQSYGSPEIVKGWLSKNEYYHQFQKELVAERLAQPE
ncbi:MAG: hypothetical protein WCK03_04880 [Candidatus Taylorbacteria bacterium]